MQQQLAIDDLIVQHIGKYPGCNLEQTARACLKHYSGAYTRDRIHALAARGIIRAEISNNRYSLYLPEDLEVGTLWRLICIHWEEIEPDGQEITPAEKFKRLEHVIREWGSYLEEIHGGPITPEHLKRLLEKECGEEDVSRLIQDCLRGAGGP